MTPPVFCGECVQPRKGLEPSLEPSKGATRATRLTWRCVDCQEKPSIVELLRRAEERRK